MKIEVSTKTINFGNLGVCGGDVFEYDGKHMMKIKYLDANFEYNAIRLSDGALLRISGDVPIKPLPNAKLITE